MKNVDDKNPRGFNHMLHRSNSQYEYLMRKKNDIQLILKNHLWPKLSNLRYARMASLEGVAYKFLISEDFDTYYADLGPA